MMCPVVVASEMSGSDGQGREDGAFERKVFECANIRPESGSGQ